MAPREAHNLQMPVRIRPPQPRKTKNPWPYFGQGFFVTWLRRRHVGRQAFYVVESRDELRSDEFYGTIIIVYYVYLLENQDDKSWYIGFSANLRQRIERHQKGDGARTTKRKQNWDLVYYEAYKSEQDAKGRERFLKSGSGRKYLKKQLVHYFAS